MKNKFFGKSILMVITFVFACLVFNLGIEKIGARTCTKARTCTCWCIDGNDIHSYGASPGTSGCTSACTSKCSSIGDTLDRAELDACGSGDTPSSTTCSYTTSDTSCSSGYTMTCNGGEYVYYGTCKDCVAGTWCDGTNFHPCGANKTSPARASSESQCTAYPKAEITCSNPTYNGSAQTIATCSGGTISNATQTSVGNYTVTCTGDSTHSDADSKTCSIRQSSTGNPKAVITCTNKVYNGSAQTIATCSGGTINNATQTSVGNYTVTCTGDSTHSDADSKTCSINAVACVSPYTSSVSTNGENDNYECRLVCQKGYHVAEAKGTCVQCTGNTYLDYESAVVYGGTVACKQCTGSTACANSTHTGCVACPGEGGGSGGPETYTITADANGGTLTTTTGWTIVSNSDNKKATKSIDADSAYGTLPTVSRTNYTLKEWNTKNDGTGTKITDSSIVTGTLTIYAIWNSGSGNTNKVIFDCNGGSGTMDPLTVTFGESVTLTANACQRTDYTFRVWKAYAKGTVVKDASGNEVTYSDKASFTNTFGTEIGDITLKAQWDSTSNTYVIHFNANGGSGTMADVTATKGIEGTLPANTFTYKGYTFNGWKAYITTSGGKYEPMKDESGKEVTFANKATYMDLYGSSAEEVTLFAQWKSNTIVNPATGILRPTIIVVILLAISGLGYYVVKKKGMSF